MISKTALHTILALARLARQTPGTYVGATKLAKEINAPSNYLGKLLQSLASEGLVESIKGHGGGFKLSKPASEISIYDIVEPLDNISRWDDCFLGSRKCDCNQPCAVHKKWSKVRKDYIVFLKTTTIEQIAKKEIKI